MTDRHGIAVQVKHILDSGMPILLQFLKEIRVSATLFWGIHVERVEIKDIRLPREMCRAMAAEAEAQRESDAKVVTAQGELDVIFPLPLLTNVCFLLFQASTAFQKAADELAGSPTALQLRYLQTLVKISAHDNHTIVIPFPIEYLKKKLRK